MQPTLAQDRVQPRGRSAAEDEPQDRVCRPRRRDMAVRPCAGDGDLRLDRVGPIHQDDTGGVCGPFRDPSPRGQGHRTTAPGPKGCPERCLHIAPAQIAGHDQRRTCRADVRGVKGTDILAGQAGHGLAGPGGRPTRPLRRVEEGGRQFTRRPVRGRGALLLDLGESAADQPTDLVRRETGLADCRNHQLQRVPEPAGRHIDIDV